MNLGAALGWKYDHVAGISTRGNKITEWPKSLGAQPTALELTVIGNEYTAYLAAEKENDWVRSELVEADKELNKHDDGHGRVTSTKTAWYQYRNALRDRVQAGVISVGERPVKPE